MSKRKIDPANYDVLLGYYSHSYQEDIVDGRVVVMDETPSDAFIREFQHDKVVQVVSHYLSQKDDIPFDNYGELTSDKISRYRRGDARKWFQAHEQEIQREGFPVMTDETGQSHAFAPLMTYALLVADDLGNGWEYTTLPEGGVAVRNRDPSKEHDESELCFLMPPSLEDAEGVIGLDGTPWQKQWELCLGTSLTHYPVLDDDERQAYLQDVLDLTIFQIGTAAKPYSSGKWVKPDDDATLFEYIGKEQRRLPDLISSERAISQYDDADILELVGESEYYGNFKGSNKFEHSRVGAVVGSPHYGDTYVEKWGAFANEAVERLSDDGGMDLDYSSFGDKILQDMRESEVLQALLRFGRDGDGTVIYVFTAALPDWVPVADTGIVKKWSPGMRQLRTVLRNRDGDEWRTSDLVVDVGGRSVLDTAAPDPISKRQVRRNLNRLADVGFIDKRTEGCGAVWEDAGIASMNGKREVLFRG